MNVVAPRISHKKHLFSAKVTCNRRDSKMMESLNEPERDVNSKQIAQEPIEDFKVNGDVNGSYDEDVAEESPDDCANGDISVPSQENGVERMDTDAEVAPGDIGEDDMAEDDEYEDQPEDGHGEEEDEEEEQHDEYDGQEVENHDEIDHQDEQHELENQDEQHELEHHDEQHELDEDDQHELEEHDETLEPREVPDVEMKDSDDEKDESEDEHEPSDSDRDTNVKESESSLKITLVNKSDCVSDRGSSLTVSESNGSKDHSENEDFSFNKDLQDLKNKSGSLEITLVKKDAPKEKKKEEKKDIVTIAETKEKDNSDDDCVEVIEKTPVKKKKVVQPVNITPRRSSRNLNKTKSYSDKDAYIDELDRKSDDDVQEIIPTDPLADDKRKIKKTTIVVNDTKKLAEIAAGSKQKTGKKEPTLVIIDTNSILSGKGAIPVSQQPSSHNTMASMSFSQASRSGFSMVPVNFQGTKGKTTISQVPSQPKPVILPSLTDDMYVVEAPSFIVPYVYEKPPTTPLKEYVTDMEKVLKEREKERKRKKKEREEKKEEEKQKEAEKKENDKEDKSDEKMDVDDEVKCDEKMEVEDEEKKKEEESDKEDKKSDKSDTDTDDEGKDSDSSSKKDSDSVEIVSDKVKKSENYFENPLGKFLMQIGVNLVQEHVQTDLLRNQKRKREREGKNCSAEVQTAIDSLLRTLEYSRESNKPYKLELQKCQHCNFKTESALVMAYHKETPHYVYKSYVYKCNFCTLEVRSPHDILFHMEAEHNVRGRLERAPSYHQCPNCPFEDNQKGKLSRHLLSCAKKYKPERNQEPPIDWEPPAKIPRVKGSRVGLAGSSLYSGSLGPRGGVPMPRLNSPSGHSLLASRGRGRPPIYVNRSLPDGRSSPGQQKLSHIRAGAGMVFRPSGSNAQPQVLLPGPYNSLYQKGNSASAAAAGATAKLLQQPSISITPLPRQPNAMVNTSPSMQPSLAKPGRPQGNSKSTFVICEICDGYIKDLEQLRNHMQWIHKVKIHPKMIYNRPPLNCQKCQFRFFTDQGLERHLLGSHGLVTSSMQEASNKGKDGGRCPVCGRVYQWKLLNHVARDHNMSLKPAHLSYKCTVCTATFGMYKQFESHVYSAHSMVAKRVIDNKKQGNTQPSTSSTSQSDSLLKPLKINDEITIIPQPARAKTKSQPATSSKPAKVIEF